MLNAEEIKNAFLATTGAKNIHDKLNVNVLTNKVYTALHAICANKMRETYIKKQPK